MAHQWESSTLVGKHVLPVSMLFDKTSKASCISSMMRPDVQTHRAIDMDCHTVLSTWGDKDISSSFEPENHPKSVYQDWTGVTLGNTPLGTGHLLSHTQDQSLNFSDPNKESMHLDLPSTINPVQEPENPKPRGSTGPRVAQVVSRTSIEPPDLFDVLTLSVFSLLRLYGVRQYSILGLGVLSR
ncbi:hypothetical protein PCH_Pc21g10270 [Penicillium rubens Wisconsin 54-1255]|uniref:Uncharacterized protein n=1 Tax=Penicillium rubens (strain ATCC 28089 / DSM 1075 / NRRL 1951 / Wisconsin 54-1255) TaxID=500485 RepID=B6HIH4_PENRW|nr:hypothetical protein PCH_Pc21g10270 [Penicillium rubens Wisconsin 54-1255]